jgi:uncharacterized protein YjbI with pentapeptide repeats
MEWRPTKRQILWAIGIVMLLLILAFIGVWLWRVLFAFIQPETPTDKKDLVNIFVVIAAGVVGTLTAIAAVGNLIVSRRNLQNAQATLQQQRDLDERHAQDDALQAYFEQMGSLLTEHKLMETEGADDPKRLLARAQTLTVLERLGTENKRANRNKRELILFLHDAGLISKDNKMLNLSGADLSDADLSGADLRGADLSDAHLSDANLSNANLSNANLQGAILSGANLSGADFSGADLTLAFLRRASLRRAILRGAILIGAKLSDANLSSADLSRAKLRGADLSRAILSGADLGRAILSGANLQGAILSGAKLRGTDLSDANLESAILSGATVTEEQLLTCRNLEGATMPKGMVYKDWLKDKERRGRDANSTDSS